jgi:hypothetical protein
MIGRKNWPAKSIKNRLAGQLIKMVEAAGIEPPLALIMILFIQFFSFFNQRRSSDATFMGGRVVSY